MIKTPTIGSSSRCFSFMKYTIYRVILMKKISISCLIMCCFSVCAEKNLSFSELKVGAENISYAEALADIAGLGKLSQSIDVTNPTVRQISYSGINEYWGFYIESSATVATEIATEQWSIGDFGEVQQNAFKIKANEIGAKVAYNFNRTLQITLGGKIYNSSFTRSNFAFIQPGAKAFDDALIALPRDEGDAVPRFNLPGQTLSDAQTPQQELDNDVSPVVSVTEDQMSVLLNTSIRYDTHMIKTDSDFSWFFEGEITIPLYNEVQNTQLKTVTLTDSFNGWGVMSSLGIRYHFAKDIALVLGVDALYKARNSITVYLENDRRVRVPDTEYSNIALSTGIFWSY